jgi:hypothetical protein
MIGAPPTNEQLWSYISRRNLDWNAALCTTKPIDFTKSDQLPYLQIFGKLQRKNLDQRRGVDSSKLGHKSFVIHRRPQFPSPTPSSYGAKNPRHYT